MSSRPREAKKLRKLEKVMRRTPPTNINLVQYLQDRRYARTAGAARQMLKDGKVKVGDEIVGRIELPDPSKPGHTMFFAVPLVPAHNRAEIRVDA